MRTLPLLLLPLAAMAAEPAAPAVRLEPVNADPAWRISAGFRAAPGIKTSAAVDARAAAAAAGAVLRPSGRGGSSSSGAGASVSVKTARCCTRELPDRKKKWNGGRILSKYGMTPFGA